MLDSQIDIESARKRRGLELQPISQELVSAICDELAAEAKPVTYKSVLEKIGGGSYSTLSPFVKAWKAERDHRRSLSLVEVPDEIETSLRFFAKEIWHVAGGLASKRLVEQSEDFERQKTELLEVTQEQGAEIRGLIDELDALKKLLESARGIEQELTQTLTQERASQRFLQDQITATQDENKALKLELDAQKNERELLSDSLSKTTREKDKAETKVEILEENERKSLEEIKKMRLSIEASEREKSKAIGELEAMKRSENSLKLELSESKKMILELERKDAASSARIFSLDASLNIAVEKSVKLERALKEKENEQKTGDENKKGKK